MEQIDQAWLLEQSQGVSKENVARMLDNMEGIIDEVGEVEELHELKPDIKIAISMVRDYHEGIFKEITWEKVAGLTYSLLYLLDPRDGIADTVPGLGFLDDFAVLVLGLELVQDELEAYKKCCKEHLKENYHL